MVVLVHIPEELLLLPDTLDGLHQAAFEKVGEGPEYLVHLVIQEGEVHRQGLDQLPGCLSRLAGNGLAVDNLAVLNLVVGDDLRVADKLVALFEHRHDLAEVILAQHLVGAPQLAGDAVPHGVLYGEGPGQEVRRAADRRRAVPGAGLPEDSLK